MERGTATSFLLPRSVTLGWACDCILGVKKASEQQSFKGRSLTRTPRFISRFPLSLPPPATIIVIWEASSLGDRLVDEAEHLLITLRLLLPVVQQADLPYGKVVGVSLALWAPGFICPNNTLWHPRGPIDFFWNRVGYRPVFVFFPVASRPL